MSDKKPKPIYVGYVGPRNSYTFKSQTTLTDRTIINNTWEKMIAAADIDHFKGQKGSSFVVVGKQPALTPREYLAAKAEKEAK